MDKDEILRKEREYYKEIRAGIHDIVHRELVRWLIIVVSILLIYLGSWMAFRYLKDTAGFEQFISEHEEKKEVPTDG